MQEEPTLNPIQRWWRWVAENPFADISWDYILLRTVVGVFVTAFVVSVASSLILAIITNPVAFLLIASGAVIGLPLALTIGRWIVRP